jgi:hypothetical protein
MQRLNQSHCCGHEIRDKHRRPKTGPARTRTNRTLVGATPCVRRKSKLAGALGCGAVTDRAGNQNLRAAAANLNEKLGRDLARARSRSWHGNSIGQHLSLQCRTNRAGTETGSAVKQIGPTLSALGSESTSGRLGRWWRKNRSSRQRDPKKFTRAAPVRDRDPAGSAEKSLAPRTGRRVLLREKSRGSERRRKPKPAIQNQSGRGWGQNSNRVARPIQRLSRSSAKTRKKGKMNRHSKCKK